MRSARFSCERTLFKKDLTRSWPLWAAYTAVWFLLVPLPVFGMEQYERQRYLDLGLTGWAGHTAMSSVCGFFGVFSAAVYGVLCAMAVWSYLYSSRAVNMTHALPVRREGHFAAHFLSGVTMFLLPHGIIFLLTLLAGAATGSRGDLGGIAAAMGIQTLLCLFFFCFASLCAFVTGHILALPALYVIANLLVYGLAFLLDWVAGKFLFGFTSSLSRSSAVKWLTPAGNLLNTLSYRFGYVYEDMQIAGDAFSIYAIPQPQAGPSATPASVTVTPELSGLHVVLIYAAVGLVFAALALVLYRRRHLEAAGDVVAVSWMRPVFQYGVAFCAALAGAWVLADILGQTSAPLLTVLLVLCGAVGYFAARMLLQKSLKVFQSGWKGCALTAAVLLALCVTLNLDLLGVERMVPDAAQVESVRLRGPDNFPHDSADYPDICVEDPALIAQILSAHQSIIDHRAQLKAAEASDPDYLNTYFRVEYTLKGGGTLERKYDLSIDPAQTDTPTSVAGALYTLINDPAFTRAAYGLDAVDSSRLTEVLADGLMDEAAMPVYVSLCSPLSSYALEQAADGAPAAEQAPAGTLSADGIIRRPASSAQLAELWRAVLADFDAGNLGLRWLSCDSGGYDEIICSTVLEFFYQVKVENSYYTERRVSVTLTSRAEHTLAAMERLGMFDGGLYAASWAGRRVFPAFS